MANTKTQGTGVPEPCGSRRLTSTSAPCRLILRAVSALFIRTADFKKLFYLPRHMTFDDRTCNKLRLSRVLDMLEAVSTRSELFDIRNNYSKWNFTVKFNRERSQILIQCLRHEDEAVCKIW